MRLVCLVTAWLVSSCTFAAQSQPNGSSISGHVTNSLTGAVVRKAAVSLKTPQFRLEANTDSEGKFQFTGLPPGTYRLSARRSSFLERRARRLIHLGPAEHVTDAEIRLPPQSVIQGRILDEDGDPVDNARVWILKQRYEGGKKLWDRFNLVSVSNEAGDYRFRDLSPGRYLIWVQPPQELVDNRYGNNDHPRSLYVPAFYPDSPSQQSALPVDIGVGTEARGIDVHLFRLALPRTVRVQGRVTGVQPDSGVIVGVSLIQVEGEGSGSATAMPPDYKFEMNVRPGQYKTSAYVYSGGSKAFATGSVTVTGNTEGVDLVMIPAPVLRGRITLAEGGRRIKLEGIRVKVNPFHVTVDRELEAGSDAGGEFVFSELIRPGQYALDVLEGSIPAGCFVQKLKLGEQEVSVDGFEIKSTAQFEVVLSTMAGEILGAVEDAKGELWPDSSVTLISADGMSRPRSASAGDDGTFRFTGLRPGRYKLFAWERLDDAQWQDPEFLAKFEGRGREITVAPREAKNVKLQAITTEELK